MRPQNENSFNDQTAGADEWIIAMRLQPNSNYLDREVQADRINCSRRLVRITNKSFRCV